MTTNRRTSILIEELQGKTILYGENTLKENLMKRLAPMTPPRTFDEIYAVVSLTSESSLVIRKNDVIRCDLPPEKLVLGGMKKAYHLDLEAYRRAVNLLFHRINYKIPLASVDCVLFPLTGEGCPIWLNPAHIDDTEESIATLIQLTNGLKLEIPIKLRSFWELALNALIVQVGIKREYDPRTSFDIYDLHHYLSLEHTIFTNTLIEKLEIEPHLISFGQFHHCFRKEQLEVQMKELFGE